MAKKLQFFVAGLGRFGISVAVTLEKMGYESWPWISMKR